VATFSQNYSIGKGLDLRPGSDIFARQYSHLKDNVFDEALRVTGPALNPSNYSTAVYTSDYSKYHKIELVNYQLSGSNGLSAPSFTEVYITGDPDSEVDPEYYLNYSFTGQILIDTEGILTGSFSSFTYDERAGTNELSNLKASGGNWDINTYWEVQADGPMAIFSYLTRDNDYITGTSYSDELCGGSGSDTIIGGDGFDFIFDGYGYNNISGGEGQDIFALYPGMYPGRWRNKKSSIGAFRTERIKKTKKYRYLVDSGVDFITDFNIAEDVIAIAGAYKFDNFLGKVAIVSQSGLDYLAILENISYSQASQIHIVPFSMQ